MLKTRGDPKLKIRLFPPRVDAEGEKAIEALVRPRVLWPITAAMIALGLFAGVGISRTEALWSYFLSH